MNKLYTSMITSALMTLASLPAQAGSACQGLDQATCAANATCTWASGYMRKDGKEVAAYCKSKGEKKATESAPPATSAPATTPTPAPVTPKVEKKAAAPAPAATTAPAATAAPTPAPLTPKLEKKAPEPAPAVTAPPAAASSATLPATPVPAKK